MTLPPPISTPVAGWLLRKPTVSHPDVLTRMRDGLERDGYKVIDRGADWEVERSKPPPRLLAEMGVRILPSGPVGGTPVDIENRIRKWWNRSKSIGGMDPRIVEPSLKELEGMADPRRDPLKWAIVSRLAGSTLAGSRVDNLGQAVSRLAAALLRWCPNGQLVFWEHPPEYLSATRLLHVIASAQSLGGDVASTAAAADMSWWIHGEDILWSPLGTLYLDLVPLGTAGMAWHTVPLSFVFEFGDYRAVRPEPIDAISFWRLHSLSLPIYTATWPKRWKVPMPGWLQRDALRSWYVAGINRLAQYLVSAENFRTDAGRLRLDAQQQAYITVARLLNSTGHLFAAGEPMTRLLDFWDVLDLYAGLRLEEDVTLAVRSVLSKEWWEAKAVAGAAALPGSLGVRWKQLAALRHRKWVREIVHGILVSDRYKGSWVRVGDPGSERAMRWHEFFRDHLEARRHTLHGYYPKKPERFRDYLAIHDGRLPPGLPEWGRYMFVALLAKPEAFLDGFSLLPAD